MEQQIEFENWYAIYFDHLRGLGWKGNIDADSATNDYNDGLSPEEAAESLFKELNS